MSEKLIVTEDGSHTLYLEDLGEHYHSTHGAIQESQHVFIESGLRQAISKKAPIKVLEVGFGTGLNALLTLSEAVSSKKKIQYVSIEPYPLKEEIYKNLNYGKLIEMKDADTYFQKMHQCNWNFPFYFTDYFILNKINSKLEDAQFQPEAFDLVFFDAFAPGKQPEVWSEENFAKIFAAMNPGGILTTYSSQGQVKRTLIAAGFEIEKIPGPKGKREILRAIKPMV
ncbi:MAG TPA: tRNA (5-methylaminomethyl-2-thiouridine)(34)-methyltransferase MnmD [Bacteroidales bacterium]|nr:tRNA (5-methylaminomethyl-2-thiouridine)(34)-methyltransferase MnmD [Bacteroidales bacterium]